MKGKLLILLCLVVTLFTACDSVRRLVGRPVSEEISDMREEIRIAEMRRQEAVRDSIAKQKQFETDSLEAVEALRAEKIIKAGALGLTASAEPGFRYYLVLGTFSMQENAQALLKKAQDASWVGLIVPVKKSFSTVLVGGSNSVISIKKSLELLKKETFCPADVWILDNE